MTTDQAIREICRAAGKDSEIVSSLGRTSDRVYKYRKGQALYLDLLGAVVPISIGLALGCGPKVELVGVDTDGSHLFGLHVLPTVAALQRQLSNLSIVVMDNEILESSGGLPSRAVPMDWELLGRTFGLSIQVISEPKQLYTAIAARGYLRYVVAKVSDSEPCGDSVKTIDGIESRYLVTRHLEALLSKSILRPAMKS